MADLICNEIGDKGYVQIWNHSCKGFSINKEEKHFLLYLLFWNIYKMQTIDDDSYKLD